MESRERPQPPSPHRRSSIDFDNTEIGFISKTDRELRRSRRLFQMMSRPGLVRFGSGLARVALAVRAPIRWAIKPTIFQQFVGGESVEECAATIEELGRHGIVTILDYCAEGKQTDEDFDHTARQIITTIERTRGDRNIPFSVFKVTGVASFALLEKLHAKATLSEEEQAQLERVRRRVREICTAAAENGKSIFIDAEESWIQQPIDDLANEMMAALNRERPVVYNTYQLYRKDRLAYLQQSFAHAAEHGYFLGAKLVRGAYMEKERERAARLGQPSPIHDTKADCDRSYDEALRFAVEHLDRMAICAGTHNEHSAAFLARRLDDAGIRRDHPYVVFSQLLGMSDNISYNLAHHGFNVAKYVPYGAVREVVPYLVRRAQENSAVRGQLGREFGLVTKEIARRAGSAGREA